MPGPEAIQLAASPGMAETPSYQTHDTKTRISRCPNRIQHNRRARQEKLLKTQEGRTSQAARDVSAQTCILESLWLFWFLIFDVVWRRCCVWDRHSQLAAGVAGSWADPANNASASLAGCSALAPRHRLADLERCDTTLMRCARPLERGPHHACKRQMKCRLRSFRLVLSLVLSLVL